MKILVTGGSGFIGRHLVRRLVNDCYDVMCLARKNSDISNLKENGVKIAYGDLLDKDSLNKAVKGVDVVYHLGAVLGSKSEDKKQIWNVNVDGTRNIIDESFNAGVKKFIHFSTFLVYGYTDKPANENIPYEAETTFYGKSKRESEKIVREYQERGMNTVIVQPTIIHGPGLNFGFSSVFPAIQKRKFMFIGNGNNLQHLGYIDNFIDGVILAGTKNKAIGKTYIIGDDEVITFKEMILSIAEVLNVKVPKVSLPEIIARTSVPPLKLLAKMTGTKPMLDNLRINFMTKNQAGSIEKIKRELGYKPKISTRKGLELSIDYYKKTGLLK